MSYIVLSVEQILLYGLNTGHSTQLPSSISSLEHSLDDLAAPFLLRHISISSVHVHSKCLLVSVYGFVTILYSFETRYIARCLVGVWTTKFRQIIYSCLALVLLYWYVIFSKLM